MTDLKEIELIKYEKPVIIEEELEIEDIIASSGWKDDAGIWDIFHWKK